MFYALFAPKIETLSIFFKKDHSYPLLVNRLASVPSGFYLASESPVLHIARGGQFDPASFLPPTNVFNNAGCSNSLFQQLLGAVHAEVNQFADQLPTYESVLRRQRQPCLLDKRIKSPPKLSSATLIPLTGKRHLFQTIAFTKIATDTTSFVDYTSCAFSDQVSLFNRFDSHD